MSSTFLDQQGLVKSIYYSILFIKLNPSVVVKNKESLNAVKVSLKPDFFLHEGRFRYRFSRFLHGRVHQSDFQFSKKKRKPYLIKISQNSKTG